MPVRPGSCGAAALAVLLPALLALAALGEAHTPKAARPWETRLLVDQNDDAYIWNTGAGHDIVAVDLSERWVEGTGHRLVLRLLLAGGYATGAASGELRELVRFQLGGQEMARTLRTSDNANFTSDWDFTGPKVAETGDGHGDFSVELGLDLAPLNLSAGAQLANVRVEGFHNDARRDIAPGGAYTVAGIPQESVNEQNEPIAFTHPWPLALRGPGYLVGLAPAATAVQAPPNATASVDVVVRNKLAGAAQAVRLEGGPAPPGWTADWDRGNATLCAGCERTIKVNLTTGAAPSPGRLPLVVLSSAGGRAAAGIDLAPPPPPGTPLELRDLRAEPGADHAVVRWNTTIPASVRVSWGPTPALGQVKVAPGPPGTQHAIRIEGLSPSTSYFARAVASNGTENVSAPVDFTTLPPPSLRFEAPRPGATLNGTATVRLGVANWTGPVELSVDGTALAVLDAPYVHSWDTRTVARGTHVLRARVGALAETAIQVAVDNPVRHPAELREGGVAPPSGAPNQTFTFSVRFVDPDGPPTRAQVLVDGVAHDLQAIGGDPATGLMLAANLTLPAGRHEHLFVAETPDEAVRFPAQGSLPGPLVQAATPSPTPSPPPPDPGPPAVDPGPTPPPPDALDARATPWPGWAALLALAVAAGGAARRPRARRALLALVLLGAMVAAAMPAHAHQTLSQGELTFIVGWAEEPAVADVRNSVEVTVINGSRPVAGATGLLAWIGLGPEDHALGVKPRSGKTGVYDGDIIPTRPGQYRVRLGGEVEGARVNLTFLEVEFVQPASDLEFPARTAPQGEGLEPRVAALEGRRAPDATPLAAGGLALGGVALAAALLAGRRPRAPGP